MNRLYFLSMPAPCSWPTVRHLKNNCVRNPLLRDLLCHSWSRHPRKVWAITLSRPGLASVGTDNSGLQVVEQTARIVLGSSHYVSHPVRVFQKHQGLGIGVSFKENSSVIKA